MSEKIKGKIKKKLIISILSPILIVVILASSYFAIIDGMVNIVESFIAKVTTVASEALDTSSTEWTAAWGKLVNIVNLFDPKGIFDPDELAKESAMRPTITMKQDDFNNIKNSIDMAQVNRYSAGLEDYMLKIMLLSYYRSVYLSDFDILMQITDEERQAIDTMNAEAAADPDKKHPCPFPYEKNAANEYYLKTSGMIIIEVVYEDLATGNIEEKPLKYYDRAVIEALGEKYKLALQFGNEAYAYSIKNFLRTTYTNSTSDHGEILVPTINDSKKTIVYNYDDPKIEDYEISESASGELEFKIINYDIVSAKYGTPVEFLMNLLEITGSRDFLNAFIEVACDPKYYIKIGLYDLTTRTTNITEEKYTEDINIEGTVDTTVHYSVKYCNSGSLAMIDGLEGVHYKTMPAEDGDTYIYITDPSASGRTYYLYKDSTQISPYVLSIDTNGDGTKETKSGWKMSTTGGIRDAFKRKYGAKVTATTTEIINEGSYETSIKEVYCWWAFIEKQVTQTEVINYANITEAGKTYVETNNMDQFVSNDLTEGLFDESNNYIINKTKGPLKSMVYLRKIDSPTVFIQNPPTPITGINGLYNQLFNKILKDTSIDYTHGTPAENAAVQAEITNNGITADKYEYNLFYTSYSNYDDLQIKEVSIIRTAHMSGGPATGDFMVDEVLALLKKDITKSPTPDNIVEYGDLYRSNTGAGEMLENGAEMLFQLLDSSENTEGLADVMRYILYRYNGIDYGVTVFDAGILGDLDFSGIGSVVKGDTVEDKVWYTLKAAGYNEYSIAAVMGNIWAESGFKTNNLENTRESTLGSDEAYTEAVNNGSYSETKFKSDSAGYGLCQWTFSTRKEGLYKFAKEDKGVGIDDPDMQIEFLLGELSKTGGANGKATCQINGTNNGYNYNSWYNPSSIEEATKAFMCIFERPAVMDEAEGNKRTTRAEYYYNMYHGKTLSGGTEEAVGSGAIVTRFTSSITGKTFTVWNQTKLDPYWIDKCNLCAAACLGSGYRSPVETETGVLNNAKSVGGFVLSNDALNKSFFDDYGLKAKIEGKSSYSKENIRTLLTSGKYICIRFNMSGTGKAAIGKSGAQYTNKNGGHWIAIIGYDYNGGNEKIYVSDSGHGETGWKNIDEFDPLKSYMSYFTIISEK